MPTHNDIIPRGTIVLVPFPFTDLSSEKLRPAVIISHARTRGQDVCVAFITSRESASKADTVLVKHTHPRFEQTGLKVSSYIRAGKIATLDRKIILGELGALPDDLIKKLDTALRCALGL